MTSGVESSESSRKVTVLKDTKLDYPELWMSVYISGPPQDARGFADMFVRARCRKAETPETADLVVFTGGPDVSPIYYADDEPYPVPHHSVSSDLNRDAEDIRLYEKCLDLGIPMFGVCRGAQFLHVMNGGKLYQHIDNHTGDHHIWDTKAKQSVEKVSSVHHQSCRRNDAGGMEVIAVTYKSKRRWLDNVEYEDGLGDDIEAFFYRDTCCLGVQGHPEYSGYHRYMKWSLDKIHEYIVCSPDLTSVKTVDGVTVWRIKKEVRDERDAKWAQQIETVLQ